MKNIHSIESSIVVFHAFFIKNAVCKLIES